MLLLLLTVGCAMLLLLLTVGCAMLLLLLLLLTVTLTLTFTRNDRHQYSAPSCNSTCRCTDRHCQQISRTQLGLSHSINRSSSWPLLLLLLLLLLW
jgi:hypothetical protein